jgi:hypothetical protein
MNPREVLRAAALLATQHAYPPLPPSLVQWSDEAQSQAEGDFPHVTMTTVSHVPEGPVSVRRGAGPMTRALVTVTLTLEDGQSYPPGVLVAHVDGSPENRWRSRDPVTTNHHQYAVDAVFESELPGAAAVDPGTITVIAEPVDGWYGVTNAAGSTPGGPTLTQRMLQTYIWTVQFKCEGFKLDSTDNNNPDLFVRKMRFGWYLQAVTAALLDPDADEAERCPVKMVDEVGQILTLNKSTKGHTLPICVYEIEFRYVDHDEDPTPIDVIESVSLGGTLADAPATITTES